MNIEKDSLDRFLRTLEIVHHEGIHLGYSWSRIASENINEEWVSRLEKQPEIAERLEAYVSRFARMQDTMADKLLPRWLIALSEKPGSQIEVLNRAERLGVVESVEEWLAARKLRNRLIHEYMEDASSFAKDLQLSMEYVPSLFESYNKVREYATGRMKIRAGEVPPPLNNSAG